MKNYILTDSEMAVLQLSEQGVKAVSCPSAFAIVNSALQTVENRPE